MYFKKLIDHHQLAENTATCGLKNLFQIGFQLVLLSLLLLSYYPLSVRYFALAVFGTCLNV